MEAKSVLPPLRQARAEQLEYQMIKFFHGRLLLIDVCYKTLREFGGGWTRAQVDRSVDDLVKIGRASIVQHTAIPMLEIRLPWVVD